MSKSAIKRVTAQLADEPREKLIEIIVRLEKRIEDLRLVPELVPTSWLDELLTGPKAVLPKVGGTITPKHIELLLNRVKARQCARISDLDREEGSSNG